MGINSTGQNGDVTCVDDGTLEFNGDGAEFRFNGNTANSGATYVVSSSTLTLNVSMMVFEGNTAKNSGVGP
jgi:hypothetical protein